LVIAITRGVLPSGQSWSVSATGIAGVSMAAYQPLFFAGVAKTGVAIGTIITIGSSPVLAGLLAYLIRGERPGWVWMLATLLAGLGSTLLISNNGDLNLNTEGVFLSLMAGFAYATSAVSSKGLLEKHPPEAVMAVVFCLGALLLSPLILINNMEWLFDPRGVIVSLHLGVLATAAAYTFYARGLMRIPVANAVSLSLAEPLTASLLGILLLGERYTLLTLVGSILILAGLVLLTLRDTHLSRT
jgi:DME family drug/metabolite transporter